MSRRLNLYGFSIARMRSLFGSGDAEAARRIRDRVAAGDPHRRPDEIDAVASVVERAVMRGVPFPDLRRESHAHAVAASAMAADGQDWLVTTASVYQTSALEGLSRGSRRYARPETRAFLHGLAEGVPLFGREPAPAEDDASVYAAVSLEKLRAFRPGLADLREQVAYRSARKPRNPGEGDDDAAGFAEDLCDWVDQVIDAGKDLWYTTG